MEKGGVGFSEVHGHFSPEFADKIPGSGTEFYATGVSLVFHPRSPHCPTVHANFRYIEHGDRAWFAGGADLTPYYFDPKDKEHFHGVWKKVCDDHGSVANYQNFSDWCDRYFYLPHRKERRGLGGIFFDYLWVKSPEESEQKQTEDVLRFWKSAASNFLESYMPIVERHFATPVSEEQRYWQEIRRGRYTEFNLIYDRGTTFGLKTGGRTESILMSLPPRARWDYCHQVEPGSPEQALLDAIYHENSDEKKIELNP